MSWNSKANLRGPAGYNATGAAEDAAALAAFARETAGPNAFGTALAEVIGETAEPTERPEWATQAHPFDARRSAYNVTTESLGRWNAALARAADGGANAHGLGLGNSIMQGAGALTPYTRYAWMELLHEALSKQLGDPGGNGWNTFQDQGSTAADPLTVITGFTRDGTRGLHKEARTSTAAGQTIAYGPITSTKFRIKWAARTDGGQFTYKINTGATTTIDTLAGAESIMQTEITVGTLPALNTLTIASLGANVTILAIEAVVTDNGRIKITRGGRNGAKLTDVTSNTLPTSAMQLWQTLAPDLVIVDMETNDFDGQTSVATFKAGHAAIIEAAHALGADVLLIAAIPPNVTELIPLSDYTRALYELADQYNVALLDFQHRWGSYLKANAAPYSLFVDTLHPSRKGHQDMARAVFEVIGGAWTQSTPVRTDAAQSWTVLQRFGYPNHGSEQIDIGGADLHPGTVSPSVPYMLASNAGALWLAAKAGQEMFLRSRVRMEGTLPITFASVATGQRPVTGIGPGSTVYDNQLGILITYNGTAWTNAATGATV